MTLRTTLEKIADRRSASTGRFGLHLHPDSLRPLDTVGEQETTREHIAYRIT